METNTQPSQIPSRRDFWEKLVLLVVDKLVFGLLIVLAAFALNLTLEHYRTDAAMKSQVAEKRVDKIAAFWGLLDEQYRTVQTMGVVADRRTPDLQLLVWMNSAGPRQVHEVGHVKIYKTGELLSEWEDRDQTIERLLRRDHFWFGDTLYKEYYEYFLLERDFAQPLLKAEKLAAGVMYLQRIVYDPRLRRRRTIERYARQISEHVAAYVAILEKVHAQRAPVSVKAHDVLDVLKQMT
jgi:hypothetical protein